jgi:hypothetical protein
MQLVRPAIATDPKLFGKGRVRDLTGAGKTKFGVSDDVKLFATTFAAGFIFVSVLIG